MTLVIDPKVALLKGVDPVQFCVFLFFVFGPMDAHGGREWGSCDMSRKPEKGEIEGS